MSRRSATDSPSIAHSTPAETRIYAVGDVHGRADLLSETMERIDEDLWRRPVSYAVEIYLGDYVDRGPDSKEVIDLLATRLVRNNAVCLRGNHEELLERFLYDPAILSSWLKLGAMQTLASYGVSLRHDGTESNYDLHQRFCRAFPKAHALFLKCLKPWICCGDYLFVHAGIRPNVPLDRQTMRDLLWIRSEFLDSPRDHGKLIVHGHTPVPHPDVRSNRINIDTGAWRSGILTCVILEDTSIQFL
ncbi:metallophosphoesterase family protein [Bradyrhizobium sp. ARR65]|uniref:metallophosphoesterase family protein n=1 Tax=Bradyrhizobium sp. ARR65 TaxID=1040989 RepID=UPI0004678881|nr:metallophosphoesterase family protein [Bradyrhizobium sp. ARR65]